MPDGDIVHNNLGRRYQEVYKEICEGQYSASNLAKKVIRAVIKDIQKAGEEPIQFIRQVGEEHQRVSDMRMYGTDWEKEFALVDELARSLYADRRFKTLAVEASKEELRDIRNGGNPSNCVINLLQSYFWKVYVAQFAEKVPLTRSHHQEATREFVDEQLARMEPDVWGQLLPYVKHAYHQGVIDLDKVRPRRSAKKQNCNIDTDLSTVGV